MEENSGGTLTDSLSLPLLNPDSKLFIDKLSRFSRTLDKLIENAINGDPLPNDEIQPGIFADAGLHFLTQEAGKEQFKHNSQTITITEEKGYFLYIANETGYIYLDKKDKISLMPAKQHDTAKMNLIYLIMPVEAGKNELAGDLRNSFDEYSTSMINNSLIDTGFLNATLNQLHPQSLVLKMGTRPRPGVDGEIKIYRKPEKKVPGDNEDHSHFFGGKPMLEVKEGELLVEKKPPKQGVPGTNIFGETIPVSQVKEAIFASGDNIRIEIDEKDGTERYFAAETGILDFHPTRISIIKEMTIEGDVGPESGDISFTRDILVKGNVKAGFTIKCGGTLTITGNVENGAQLFCTGNLMIMKGALGEETQIKAENDARFAYIQNAHVFVKGNAVVERYIYNSHFFCGNELVVEGNKSETVSHGCVVGGKVCAMEGMKLHSAGSEAVKTQLVLGVNENLVKTIDKINEILVILARKILTLQDSIGFNLKSDDFREELKSMPQVKKDQIRKKMEEIKKLALQKLELEKKLPDLKKAAYSEKEEISLTIETKIIPELILVLKTRHHVIKDEMEARTISLNKGSVKILQAEKEKK